MRALVIHPGSHWSTADVYRGWCRGLAECGVQVAEYNLEERMRFFEWARITDPDTGEVVKELTWPEVMEAASEGIQSACYRFLPDVVVAVSGGAYTPPDLYKLLRSRGAKVVIVHTESPYEDDRQLAITAQADPTMVLLNDPTHLDAFAELCPTFYVPHAYDPAVHHPGTSDHKADCVFIGTGFPSRADYLRRVDWAGVDLALGGLWASLEDDDPLRGHVISDDVWECVDNDDTAAWYRGAATGFNLYRTESERDELADGWACGPREIEMAACGLWFARDPRPESDDLFPMLPAFHSPEELGDLIRWALRHPEQRATAAERCRGAVADRTFKVNAEQLLGRLDHL